MAYPNLVDCNPFGGTFLTSPLAEAWSQGQFLTVASTAAWYEVDAFGNPTQIPIGQSGPFLVEVDGEGILCSAVEGLAVLIYQSGGTNGRGYSGSQVAHPEGSEDNPNLTVIATSAQAVTEGDAVSSVFGRTGAVVAGNADYLAVPHGGLTGAVAATRFVGGTTTGHPVTGTFALGDFVVTQDGVVWVCTTAGTPGTWTNPDGSNATASATVTGPDAFGDDAAVGSAATFSKGDHDHGLPADPTADLRADTGATTLIYPEQHATVGAPSYVKGALYFDTTLNKLRVGGASAWETVTSA